MAGDNAQKTVTVGLLKKSRCDVWDCRAILRIARNDARM